MALKVY